MKIKRNIAFLLLFGMVAALMQFWNEQNRSQAESVYSDEQIRMEMVALQEDVQPMKETTFQIVITERPEIPVRSADLKLHITMPNMFCGVFPADIVEWEPGVYSATAIPVMKGLWQAEAVLQWEDKRITVSTLFHVNGYEAPYWAIQHKPFIVDHITTTMDEYRVPIHLRSTPS